MFVGPVVEEVVETVDVVLVALLDDIEEVAVPFTPIQMARVSCSARFAYRDVSQFEPSQMCHVVS